MTKKQNKLLIFTRSPVLGEVKTRLQPDYSPQQSLALHSKLLLNTLKLSETLTLCDTELCCTPNRNTTFFLQCEKKFPLMLTDQQGTDLGERMAFAFSVALQTYNKVVIIGTDCPDLDESYIEQALASLNDVDVVIGPAADGGYVLLGLSLFVPELFSNISWGSDAVLEQSQKVIKDLSLSYHELAIMHDIDRPEDLQRHQQLLNDIT